MATTTYGSPYVQSSDLVSGWPTASQNVADRIDDVAMKGNGINAQVGTTYTLVLTDAGKNVTRSNGSASTLDIPTNASVAFETGTVVGVTNLGSGAVTIQGSGVTINGSSLVLAQYEAASLMKTATDTWVVVKGGGVPKASVSSTTGSPTTSANGNATAYKFTGDGSITVTAGLVDVLLVGGGGSGGRGDSSGGGGGGGGAGAMAYLTSVYLPAGTYTVTLGAGGTAGTTNTSGGTSLLGGIKVPGGGAGGSNGATGRSNVGLNGGSGGGARFSQAAGLAVGGYGNDGVSHANGGGGGAGGAASGATGGAGTANSITGGSVTYAAGGNGNTGTTGGTANTGNGGPGGLGLANGGNGGSGVVIILVGTV